MFTSKEGNVSKNYGLQAGVGGELCGTTGTEAGVVAARRILPLLSAY